MTDVNEDNIMINSDLKNKPHLSMYLQDDHGKLLFFDIDLPKLCTQLDAGTLPGASKDLMEQANSWFIPYDTTGTYQRPFTQAPQTVRTSPAFLRILPSLIPCIINNLNGLHRKVSI